MSGTRTHIEIVIAIIVLCCLCGCRSQQVIQNHDYRDSVYIERYIRDTLPADTSYIVTLIECDSLTNEPKIQLSDVYVDDLKLWVEQQANNKFKFNVLKPQDKIKVIEQSNSSDRVEVIAVERNLNKFEWFLLISGIVGWLIVITSITIKIYKYIKGI